jgi:hypothetical protein
MYALPLSIDYDIRIKSHLSGTTAADSKSDVTTHASSSGILKVRK